MGWVSYLEDITERLGQDLETFRELARQRDTSSAQLRSQVQALLRACDTALAEIRSHLELATDPQFDMAYEISQLDKEKAQLEGEVSDLEKRKRRLQGALESLESERKGLKLEVKNLNRRMALKEAELNQLLTQNPDLAYEVYSKQGED